MTSSKMLAAALLCCPIKLKLVGRMKLGLAVSDGRVWEPRAIPPRMAASERVGVDGLLARNIALLVVVATYANRTVALACPWVEGTPSAGDSK